MKSLVMTAIVTMMVAMAFVPAIWAAEIQGKIKSMDPAGRTLVLQDGTRLSLGDTTRVDRKDLRPGTEVKASYETVGDQKVITSIEVNPTQSKSPSK